MKWTMKRNTQLLILGACLLISSSCTRYYYQPHNLPAPMLAEKNDLHLDFSASFSEDATQANAMVAYAPIDHLGVFVSSYNYSYNAANPEPGTDNVDGRANLLELGIGGFYPITEGAPKMRVIAEAYGGYAFGKLASDVDANLSRIFIQPGISLRSNYFDMAFHIRVSNFNYANYDDKGTGTQYLNENKLLDPNGNPTLPGNYLLVEPGISLMGGYKFIKAKLSIVRTLPLTNMPWHMNIATVNIGLSFQIQDLIELTNNNASQ